MRIRTSPHNIWFFITACQSVSSPLFASCLTRAWCQPNPKITPLPHSIFLLTLVWELLSPLKFPSHCPPVHQPLLLLLHDTSWHQCLWWAFGVRLAGVAGWDGHCLRLKRGRGRDVDVTKAIGWSCRQVAGNLMAFRVWCQWWFCWAWLGFQVRWGALLERAAASKFLMMWSSIEFPHDVVAFENGNQERCSFCFTCVCGTVQWTLWTALMLLQVGRHSSLCT